MTSIITLTCVICGTQFIASSYAVAVVMRNRHVELCRPEPLTAQCEADPECECWECVERRRDGEHG